MRFSLKNQPLHPALLALLLFEDVLLPGGDEGEAFGGLLIQVVCNRRKLLQRRFQIGRDVGGDDFGSG